jgi:hypothetical protein
MNFFEARVVDGKVMIGSLELDLPTGQSTVSGLVAKGFRNNRYSCYAHFQFVCFR